MKKRLLKNPQRRVQAGKHRPPENKQAGNRAGLTFSEKKRLAELKRILAGNGREQAKPDTAQKTITFKKMFRDGICQVTHKFYTKMVEFYDINYDLLEIEDQGDILEEYSKLINYFDPSIKFELFLFNRQVSEQTLADQFDIPLQDDDFDDIREEYTQMLKHQSAKRLWISSMEESAIRDGFENLKPGSDYDHLYHSALCRQEADWLVGINGTRLFTVLYGGKMLKVGRVQTPTLAMLVERESRIMNFKKEQYFMAHILCGGVDAVTERIDSKTEAEKIAGACRNGQALVTSVSKEEKAVAPPKLYDLTTLQRDANRLFGFTAKQTLEYMQSLYEKKLCTYPRTDSQYLSDDMEQTAGSVIEAVFGSILFEENVMFNPDIKRVLNSKKVTDYHAIIPTMEIAKADLAALPETERKILSLVAGRLLCATGEKHLYETVKAELSCGGCTFATSGKSVLKNGWKDFEDAFKRSFKTTEEKDSEEKKLPELSEGQTFDGVQTKISEHYTTPPKHFTEDSLLSAMERAGSEDMGDDVERKGLGTPATRADIIEKLVKDGFVKREKKQMIPTEDGMKLITVLPDVVKSPKLTADWESVLTLVAKGEMEREEFMADIETMVYDLIRTYHEVSNEQKKMFAQEQKALGKCPNCGGEVVKGKYGAYCTNKCGMNVSRIMGVALSDEQVSSLLAGKKTLLKGLTSKAGKKYDAYIIPSGTEEYHYTKDGEEKSGVQFKFVMEFPKKKFSGGKKK